MNEIDTALRRLAQAPPPAHLARMEAVVFERIDGYSFVRRKITTSFRVGAVALALIMGIVGGLIPRQPADATDSLVPISDAAKLAPSTLLLGDR